MTLPSVLLQLCLLLSMCSDGNGFFLQAWVPARERPADAAERPAGRKGQRTGLYHHIFPGTTAAVAATVSMLD